MPKNGASKIEIAWQNQRSSKAHMEALEITTRTEIRAMMRSGMAMPRLNHIETTSMRSLSQFWKHRFGMLTQGPPRAVGVAER